MACFGALLWLAEEGLLRYVDTIRQEALDQAVLTRDAFIRLSAPAPETLTSEFGIPEETAAGNLPPSVQEDLSTHIHLIRKALRGGNSARISQIMQATFFADRGNY